MRSPHCLPHQLPTLRIPSPSPLSPSTMSASVIVAVPDDPAPTPKKKRSRPLSSSKPQSMATFPPLPSFPPLSFSFDDGVSLLLTAITLPISTALSAYAEALQCQLQNERSAPPPTKRRRKASNPSSSSSKVPTTQPPSPSPVPRRPARARKARSSSTVAPPPVTASTASVDDSETEDEGDAIPAAHVGPLVPPAILPSALNYSTPRRSSPRTQVTPTPSSSSSPQSGLRSKTKGTTAK